ncbi:hypothetical protein E1176_08905, partial [Fulvivirga sp. RKSG066]|nr:hypothetical protein [Fulvivirga aurantia]
MTSHIIKSLLFGLFVTLISFNNTNAQVVVSPANGGSNLCVGGGYTTLGDITITEGISTDFANGTNQTYVISAPANFRFNVGATVTLSQSSGGGTVTNIQPAVITTTSITFEYDMASTAVVPVDVFTISGIEIRAISPASTGNILRTGGTATQTGNAPAESQNHGSLVSGDAPSITGDPSSSTICENPGNASFTVTATGTNLSYQWQESSDGISYANLADGGIYSGSSTSNLMLTAATTLVDGNYYRAVVSGTCAPSATSSPAQLTVEEETTITANPTDNTACEDDNATFSVTATGTGLTYQWEE